MLCYGLIVNSFFAPQVIYGKAGDVAKECEALTFLGEVVKYPYILTLGLLLQGESGEFQF